MSSSDLSHSSGAQSPVSEAGSAVIDVAASTARVSCDGGGGALGHPRIWLTLSLQPSHPTPSALCPYCSRQFVQRS